MGEKRCWASLVWAVSFALAWPGSGPAALEKETESPTFTYQGSLRVDGTAVTGAYDLQFILYDAEVDGARVGPELTAEGVELRDGLFTVDLDFGPKAFIGEARWLDIAVRPSGSAGEFTPRDPRQPILSTPSATYADSSAQARFAVRAGDADLLEGLTVEQIRDHSTGGVQRLVREFELAEGATVSAGQAVSFVAGTSRIQPGYLPEGLGPKQIFHPGDTFYHAMAALGPNRFVLAYAQTGNSFAGAAVIGELQAADNTIAFGQEFVFNAENTGGISVAMLDEDRFVVTYARPGGIGGAIVGEVSGMTISYGAEHVYAEANSNTVGVAALSPTSFIATWDPLNPPIMGGVRAAKVSGGEVTFGEEAIFNVSHTLFTSATPLSSERFVVTYRDDANGNVGTAFIGRVAGTSVIGEGERIFNAGAASIPRSLSLAGRGFVTAFADATNADVGTAVFTQLEPSTVIGIAREGRMAPASVPVTLLTRGSLSDTHNSLETGATYFAEPGGNLVPNDTGVRIGVAVSATEILVLE